jgi:hypothetical protein
MTTLAKLAVGAVLVGIYFAWDLRQEKKEVKQEQSGSLPPLPPYWKIIVGGD